MTVSISCLLSPSKKTKNDNWRFKIRVLFNKKKLRQKSLDMLIIVIQNVLFQKILNLIEFLQYSRYLISRYDW